ncbi:MAG: translation initiation factor IF-2 N-terminal domain-containing protein, partial [Planctomycetes bacterium]|nr:translation initiation factor IF-2 N-terminal domain-containing protein [Planctomycetota bacterium]
MTSPSEQETTATEIMVVNDSPGEECRIAILQDNHLEELYTERTATATNVGNIYKGRVTNVESAIQAAFIDYGEGQAGFLHISDLHPRYFPGEKQTERVGKKIPRRSRPPIQNALKRGQEVLVQVLKEGVGTKGPTLTSYLSVPGRLLVMMPEMDRVGVSRKVEDLEKRREMRDILDSLKLPEGFGFILRTAGFGRTKAELNRDVAYLNRLWKVMDKRIKTVGAPCELYTESDLFVRTIRDILRPSITAIIIDSEQCYDRARALLSVVAPRTAPTVVRYHDPVPIFHAFGIERQIDLIHDREVPLPSGGKLVIEQTEALVAIDVNSGRSRRASDSETNAYRTNCEAVDEICRQLRLRDMGGLVINDLIDMHQARHRRDIEDRFRAGLARDRARTTMLRISDFGIAELTRQRMRPSLRKSHFMSCSHCDGHGEVKNPESVGADASRQSGYLLQFDRVRRIELVCSPRVASVLLSSRRREMVRLEDATGKKIDVRVSETIAVDRVDFHAYDERNADIDIDKLPAPRPPTLASLQAAASKPPPEVASAATAATAPRRRRRRGKTAPADALTIALETAAEHDAVIEAEVAAHDGVAPAPAPVPATDVPASAAKKKRSRRRSRRGRGGAPSVPTAVEESLEAAAPAVTEESLEATAPAVTEESVEATALVDARETGETQAAVAADTEPDADRAAPSGPIRIHRLARELGLASRNILKLCLDKCGMSVKNHMSSISQENAELIRSAVVPEEPAASDAAAAGDAVDARETGDAPEAEAAAAAAEPAPGETPVEESAGDQPAGERRPRRRRGGRR